MLIKYVSRIINMKLNWAQNNFLPCRSLDRQEFNSNSSKRSLHKRLSVGITFLVFFPHTTFIFPVQSHTMNPSVNNFSVGRKYVILTGREKVVMVAVILTSDMILFSGHH